MKNVSPAYATFTNVLPEFLVRRHTLALYVVVRQPYKRMVDYMGDIRPFFGTPEHGCQAPGTVKIQTGQ